MKVGNSRWSHRYFCDKCGKEIQYIGQKGFVGINHYYKSTQRTTTKKAFDLCAGCEKSLKRWFKEKETPTLENMLDRFEIYKED